MLPALLPFRLSREIRYKRLTRERAVTTINPERGIGLGVTFVHVDVVADVVNTTGKERRTHDEPLAGTHQDLATERLRAKQHHHKPTITRNLVDLVGCHGTKGALHPIWPTVIEVFHVGEHAAGFAKATGGGKRQQVRR